MDDFLLLSDTGLNRSSRRDCAEWLIMQESLSVKPFIQKSNAHEVERLVYQSEYI